jgi:hypothetical protein
MHRLVGRVSRLVVSSAVTAAALAVGAVMPFDHAAASGRKSPPARQASSMTYDAARSEVVLFGGYDSGGVHLSDTWTWDGSTWTEQHPVTSPSARDAPGLAYDALRDEVVLFGGRTDTAVLNDTWTWDGTNWTEQHPAKSPPIRVGPGMAFDADRGNIVLFGGYQGCYHCNLRDTWTWDGINWKKQRPATSPSKRDSMGMAYDAASGKVVMFGGIFWPNGKGDTWTWDGSNWTQESPSSSPPARGFITMAYDAPRGEVVLFGGWNGSYLGDTWTWDGTTWTQQQPARSPGPRNAMSLEFDAGSGKVVGFGGHDDSVVYGDTWSWNGTNWGFPLKAHLRITPSSGPPGTIVQIESTGFAAFEEEILGYFDPIKGAYLLGTFWSDASGTLVAQVTIPPDVTRGVTGKIRAHGVVSHKDAYAKFTVT